MSKDYGFYISKLVVSGKAVKPAELEFSKGFNVITGLSDTGKSYIFSCINYMLGGNDIPKEIPEGNKYSEIKLEIKTYSNKTYTLSRDLKAGNFTVKEVELDKFKNDGIKFELTGKHVKNSSENISSFLLNISGFVQKYVKTNQRNEKRELSYRDIAKLTLIDEERIITENSPVYYSRQYIAQTQEQSVLDILLTGKDAKDLVQIEDAKVYTSRIKGKIEFLESLIKDITIKIESKEQEISVEKQKELQSRMEILSEELLETSKELEILMKTKNELFDSINELRSKTIFHEELSNRFELLREHYNNDIKRLEFITQGEELFSQLKTIKCPLCGGEMDKDHYDCIIKEGVNNSSVLIPIEIEVEKIKIKLADLESTILELVKEKSLRNSKIEELQKKYETIESEIQTNIAPIKANTRQEIDLLIEQLSINREQDILKNQLTSFYGQKKSLEIELTNKPKVNEQSKGMNYEVFADLCKVIETILKKWKYPNLSNVNFNTDYKIYNLVIGNKPRKSHGKGIRAITYTSFIIGVMEYCIKNNLPHSRNIVIDSPLTTYHGKETDSKEDVSTDMQEAFFYDLSQIALDKQIIILDNKDPREELKSKINYIHFTGDSQRGRQGFFPSE